MLSWSDNSDNEAGFRIERAEGAGGEFVTRAILPPNTTRFLDVGLNDTATYRYRVCAFNAFGDSGFSNVAEGTTLSGTGPAPGQGTPHPSAPTIAIQPVGGSVAAGSRFTLSVAVDAVGAATYQWFRDGVALPQATGAVLVINDVAPSDAGAYRVEITTATGSVASEETRLVVDAAELSGAWLSNLSARAYCGAGEEVVLLGFVIKGRGNRNLLIRAIGPRLADFGLSGVLGDPTILLKKQVGALLVDLDANDNWSGSGNLAAVQQATVRAGAFDLRPGSRDAVLCADLEPASYSLVSRGADGSRGIVMAELYDVGDDASQSRLVNLSIRATVGDGAEVLIAGFVISGRGTKTLLIRAVGPMLAGFGVRRALEDPRVTVFRHQTGEAADVLAISNDDWGDNPGASVVASLSTRLGAFPLAPGGKDAAVLATLGAGVYTVHVSGAQGDSGVTLFELYDVP